MTDLGDRINGILHEPTQVHDDGRVDLTVAAITRVIEPGRIDFGGGELEAASTEPIPTTRRHPDDEYEWWNLDAGTYLATFNESLRGGEPIRIQPRDALLVRGGYHPGLRVPTLSPIPVTVGGAGLRLKENARITTATVPG